MYELRLTPYVSLDMIYRRYEYTFVPCLILKPKICLAEMN